jgi:integrase
VLVAPTPTTLREFTEAWLAGAEDGSIRNRSGDRYKPSTLRGYEQAMREYVLPELGGAKLHALRRQDIQRLADELAAREIKAATARNALVPLRAICRRALARGEIQVNPTTGIELAAVRGRRERFATPAEARQLIEAAPPEFRALWATAFYAGLRRGELIALRWSDVDLAGGVIRVQRSWDVKEGVIQPKSAAGVRTVPIAAVLGDYLIEHRLSNSTGLVFGRDTERPWSTGWITERASRAWKTAKLKPITLHECRHTFASLMIAAGVNRRRCRPSWATRRSP